MSRFIDEHRGRFGVEPICRVLGVSASAYYHRNSGARSARQVDDERLLARIEKVHAANYHAYGYRRTWKALLRAGETCGRDRVKRLMRTHGIQGAKRRGKPWRTTITNPAAHRAPDLVQRCPASRNLHVLARWRCGVRGAGGRLVGVGEVAFDRPVAGERLVGSDVVLCRRSGYADLASGSQCRGGDAGVEVGIIRAC